MSYNLIQKSLQLAPQINQIGQLNDILTHLSWWPFHITNLTVFILSSALNWLGLKVFAFGPNQTAPAEVWWEPTNLSVVKRLKIHRIKSQYENLFLLLRQENLHRRSQRVRLENIDCVEDNREHFNKCTATKLLKSVFRAHLKECA